MALGGAMLIGGGAALSALSGALLTPQSGALPLLYIQVLVATLSLLCILFVIWREAQIEKSQS